MAETIINKTMSQSPYGSPCHTNSTIDGENDFATGFIEEFTDHTPLQTYPIMEERLPLPMFRDYEQCQQYHENDDLDLYNDEIEQPRRQRRDSFFEKNKETIQYVKQAQIQSESQDQKAFESYVEYQNQLIQNSETYKKITPEEYTPVASTDFDSEAHEQEPESIVDSVLSHLNQKSEDGKVPSYGNDELCKKVMRKLVDDEVKKFKQFCEPSVPTNLSGWVDALKSFLMLHHGIPESVLTDEVCLKLAKELYFPLNVKRTDQTFGHFIEKRGKEGRNAFLRRGTKKEAKIFFSNQIGKQIFYKKFTSILEMFIDSDSENKQPKLSTFMKRLEKALLKQAAKK